MRPVVLVVIASILVLFTASCRVGRPATGSVPAQSQGVASDTFFSGCAYVDEDGNEQLDTGEPLLGGLSFSFTLAGGAGFGAKSVDGECAFVTVPAALPPEAWPVVARVEVPEGYMYSPIGPTEIELERPETRAEFRFSPQ
jgi:hypothetical protein